MTQHDYLNEAKTKLNLTWDSFAEKAGIHPRALKTYRMPEHSKNYRTMPRLAKAAIEILLKNV